MHKKATTNSTTICMKREGGRLMGGSPCHTEKKNGRGETHLGGCQGCIQSQKSLVSIVEGY